MKRVMINSSNFSDDACCAHDMQFIGLNFCYESKRLTMMLSAETNTEERAEIHFENVLGYEMIACDFWGPTPHVADWLELRGDARRLYPRYMAEIEKHGYDARLHKDQLHMEIEVRLISGDILNVLCESITIERDI